MEVKPMDIESFRNTPVYTETHQYLRHLASVAPSGYTLEFGVWQGASLRTLCGARPFVYGFDTFTGLPERWELSDTNRREVGCFAYPEWRAANWPTNCELVPGLFADTLPGWLATHNDTVALVHIDSDLYSSCRDVLTLLNDRITPGTVIAFDELTTWDTVGCPYPNWENHEWRALNEWLHQYDRKVEPLCRTNQYQAAVRVTR